VGILGLVKGMPKIKKRVEKYLQINGYETNRDLKITGKSGAKHKLDILAIKSDAVTKTNLLVECKNWNRIVGKNAVSKVHKVMADTSISNGIIVSLSSRFGFSTQAKKVAEDLGIDLWDIAELERRLETTEKLSHKYQLEATKFVRTTLTLSPKILQKEAEKISLNQKTQREKIDFIEFTYLPCYLIQFTTVRKGVLSKKGTVRVLWILCESIEGKHYSTPDSHVRFRDVHLRDLHKASIIAPKKTSAAIKKETEDAYSELDKLASFSKELMRLGGINHSLEDLKVKPTIRSIKELYYPLFVALINDDDEQRWLVVDAYSGVYSEEMSDIFNRHFDYIKNFVHS
jgi:hypothetical protein